MRKDKKKTKEEAVKKQSWFVKLFGHPFEHASKKAEKALADAEKLMHDSNKIIKVGAIVFVSTMGLSMISSMISIRLGLRAMKENKTREEIMLFNLIKKYADKA